MTGNVFDYSVAAVERVSAEKFLEIETISADRITLSDYDGYLLSLYRSESGRWVWAWKYKEAHIDPDGNFWGYSKDCEDKFLWVEERCAENLDKLILRGVLSWRAPAAAIRAIVNTNWRAKRRFRRSGKGGFNPLRDLLIENARRAGQYSIRRRSKATQRKAA